MHDKEINPQHSDLQCSRCGTKSPIKTGYCVSNCNTQWEKNSTSTFPVYYDSPQILAISLCEPCILKASREGISFETRKNSKSIFTSIVLIPLGIGIFLGAWYIATQILGVQKGSQDPAIGIVFGAIYLISLGMALFYLVMLPISVFRLIKVKTLSTTGNISISVFLEAIKSEGRRIVDILLGQHIGTYYGQYKLIKTEYIDLPDDIKLEVVSKPKKTEFEIKIAAITFDQLIEKSKEDWKDQLVKQRNSIAP